MQKGIYTIASYDYKNVVIYDLFYNHFPSGLAATLQINSPGVLQNAIKSSGWALLSRTEYSAIYGEKDYP